MTINNNTHDKMVEIFKKKKKEREEEVVSVWELCLILLTL